VTTSYRDGMKDLPPDLHNVKDHLVHDANANESMSYLHIFTDVSRNGQIRLCG